MFTSRTHQRGFTLVELIVFIVVVGVGLAGILSVSTNVVKSSADPMIRKQAMALADSILEEILQKEYEDPDGLPNAVESGRDTFDDVDDYDGKTKAVFTDWPTTLSAYTVTIAVTPTTISGIAAKQVTVTVTGTGASNVIAMTGYRTKY